MTIHTYASGSGSGRALHVIPSYTGEVVLFRVQQPSGVEQQPGVGLTTAAVRRLVADLQAALGDDQPEGDADPYAIGTWHTVGTAAVAPYYYGVGASAHAADVGLGKRVRVVARGSTDPRNVQVAYHRDWTGPGIEVAKACLTPEPTPCCAHEQAHRDLLAERADLQAENERLRVDRDAMDAGRDAWHGRAITAENALQAAHDDARREVDELRAQHAATPQAQRTAAVEAAHRVVATTDGWGDTDDVLKVAAFIADGGQINGWADVDDVLNDGRPAEVGDTVECIDTNGVEDLLTAGCRYTVRAVGPAPFVFIAGRAGRAGGFRRNRFRVVKRANTTT